MSIKALVKEHFSQNLISRHLAIHNSNIKETEFGEALKVSENLLIKKITLSDMERCAELYLRVFSADPWYDDWISLGQVRNYLEELIFNPVFEGFLACEGDEVVAVCLGHRRSWWRGRELFIDEFYVANEKQGNGIGSRLIKYVQEYLSQEGYERFILLTNEGLPAQEFYTKNGFYINSERICMIKNL